MKDQPFLLAFYGDDFTGSTDAMEVLAKRGHRTVLFLQPPSPEMLQSFEGIRCIGVAGTSRAKTPLEMEKELRPVMKQLAQIGAPIIHYKVCSTFDSSPSVGSIGKAIRVSREYFPGQAVVPVLVGAPELGRYTVFGQHFARLNDQVYRLDRHPVMSRHPVTPMDEADLRLHLGQQLEGESITTMDILELAGESEAVAHRYRQKLAAGAAVVIFDVLDEVRMEAIGKLLWETVGDQPQFVVGSSGVEYALIAHWESEGLKAELKAEEQPVVHAADQLLVISGSASLVSQQQIENALQQGFHGIKIPPTSFGNENSAPHDFLEEAVELLRRGRSVVLYTALGPGDEAIQQTREILSRMGVEEYEAGARIGRMLGKWTKYMLERTELHRLVIAGGDTSGFVTSELGIYGLEMLLPVSLGAPLCKVYAHESRMDGLELVLKSGQFGTVDFFTQVKKAKSK